MGLSFLNPVEATTDLRQMLAMSTLRDQAYLGGALLDVGFADSRGYVRNVPQGNALYEITPFGNLGNYFSNEDRHFYRQQWIANLFLPTRHLFGSHQLKFGIDFEREAFHQKIALHDYEVLRDDNSVARYVTFAGSPFTARKNFEGAQYIQDSWTPRDGLAVEAGVRVEWNEIVRDLETAPRIAVAWAPKSLPDTKFSAGWGLYYDAISLGMVAHQSDLVSLSTFYLPGGAVQGPVTTAFLVNDQTLAAPYSQSASLGVERKLTHAFYLKAGYTRRAGNHGFTFMPPVRRRRPSAREHAFRHVRLPTGQPAAGALRCRGRLAAAHLRRQIRVVRGLHAVERAFQRGGGLQPGESHLRPAGRRAGPLGRAQSFSHVGLGAASHAHSAEPPAVSHAQHDGGLPGGVPDRLSIPGGG